MLIKEIAVFSVEEYNKYKSLVPVIKSFWWLRTPACLVRRVCCVQNDGNIDNIGCEISYKVGVRPVCVFDIKFADPVFWYKIGSKIKYGKYNWTVVDIQNSELFALCDDIIGFHCFDEESDAWQESRLKTWLEAEGLKLITT